MLIDTHAHLDDPEFAGELEALLARASGVGVTRVITIGTSLASSRRAVELAEQFPGVFAVVGVHPSEALEAPEDVLSPLRELARHPRVVAIGETGMDFHKLPGEELPNRFGEAEGQTPASEAEAIKAGAVRDAQASIFAQQLDLAVELGLNVVIHQRAAWEATLELLRGYTGRVRGVFHCWGGPFEEAQEVLALGHLVSFTGIVTFKNAPTVQEVATRLEAGQFMVETDCPYLAPVPFRGQRCEPAHARQVAEKIAGLRGVELAELAAETSRVAERFFRFPI